LVVSTRNGVFDKWPNLSIKWFRYLTYSWYVKISFLLFSFNTKLPKQKKKKGSETIWIVFTIHPFLWTYGVFVYFALWDVSHTLIDKIFIRLTETTNWTDP
jgi:hypothetical protein